MVFKLMRCSTYGTYVTRYQTRSHASAAEFLERHSDNSRWRTSEYLRDVTGSLLDQYGL